jgi:hypothetical protein
MRMLNRVVRAGAADLEAPHVIAEVSSRDEVRFDEVDQISVDGRPVEPEESQFFGNFSVTPWRGRPLEKLHHGDARRRAAQA